MHPSRLRFTCRTRPITEGSSHLWLTHPGSARCPEPLCPLRVLPFEGWCFPPPREALPPHHRSYGLMRQTKTLPLPSMYTTGLCRLSPVPAGRWPFPTLSPRVLPQVPGPLPRWDPLVHLPVSSQRTSAFPRLQEGRLPHLPAQRLQYGTVNEAAVIPLCSGPQVCSPPRSLLPQSKDWAAVTFTSEHPTVRYLPVSRIY